MTESKTEPTYAVKGSYTDTPLIYYGGSVATDDQRRYFNDRIYSVAYNNPDNLEVTNESGTGNWSKLREEVQKAVDRCRDDIMASDNARYMKAVVEEFAKGDYA